MSVIQTTSLTDPTSSSANSIPQAVVLDDGSILNVWVEFAASVQLKAQVFSKDGTALGDPYIVSAGSKLIEPVPSIAKLNSGEIVVGWNNGDNQPLSVGSSDTEYLAQIVSVSQGTITLTKSDFVVYNPYYNTGDGGIVATTDGGFVIALGLHSRSQDGISGSDSWELVGQRFDQSGASVGSWFHINTSTWGNQSNPDLAALPNGGFLATYRTSSTSTNTEVYAQIFDANNTKVGSEINISSTSGMQEMPEVIVLANGNILIGWISRDGIGHYVRELTTEGEFVTDPVRINDVSNIMITNGLALAPLASGGFVASWSDKTNVDGADVWSSYYQTFDSSLQAVGAPVSLGSISDSNANLEEVSNRGQDVAIAVDGDDIIVLYEQDSIAAEGGSTIAMTVVSDTFTSQDSDLIVIDTPYIDDPVDLGFARYPNIAKAPDGTIYLASDPDTSNGGAITVEQFTASGEATGVTFTLDPGGLAGRPKIEVLENGNLVVAKWHYIDGQYNLYYDILTSDGQNLASGLSSQVPADDYRAVQVLDLGNGRFALDATYQDNFPATPITSRVMRLFDYEGQPVGDEFHYYSEAGLRLGGINDLVSLDNGLIGLATVSSDGNLLAQILDPVTQSVIHTNSLDAGGNAVHVTATKSSSGYIVSWTDGTSFHAAELNSSGSLLFGPSSIAPVVGSASYVLVAEAAEDLLAVTYSSGDIGPETTETFFKLVRKADGSDYSGIQKVADGYLATDANVTISDNGYALFVTASVSSDSHSLQRIVIQTADGSFAPPFKEPTVELLDDTVMGALTDGSVNASTYLDLTAIADVYELDAEFGSWDYSDPDRGIVFIGDQYYELKNIDGYVLDGLADSETTEVIRVSTRSDSNETLVLGDGFGLEINLGDGPLSDADVLVVDGGALTFDLSSADENGYVSYTLTDANGVVGSGVIRGADIILGSEITDVGDQITGDAGNNIIVGFAGDDTLIGGAGDDFIIGGVGSDTIDGGDGRDIIIDLDADALTGGAGKDVFVVRGSPDLAASATITDLEVSKDGLSFDGLNSQAYEDRVAFNFSATALAATFSAILNRDIVQDATPFEDPLTKKDYYQIAEGLDLNIRDGAEGGPAYVLEVVYDAQDGTAPTILGQVKFNVNDSQGALPEGQVYEAVLLEGENLIAQVGEAVMAQIAHESGDPANLPPDDSVTLFVAVARQDKNAVFGESDGSKPVLVAYQPDGVEIATKFRPSNSDEVMLGSRQDDIYALNEQVFIDPDTGDVATNQSFGRDTIVEREGDADKLTLELSITDLLVGDLDLARVERGSEGDGRSLHIGYTDSSPEDGIQLNAVDTIIYKQFVDYNSSFRVEGLEMLDPGKADYNVFSLAEAVSETEMEAAGNVDSIFVGQAGVSETFTIKAGATDGSGPIDVYMTDFDSAQDQIEFEGYDNVNVLLSDDPDGYAAGFATVTANNTGTGQSVDFNVYFTDMAPDQDDWITATVTTTTG